MLTEFGELGFDYSVNWCPNNTVDPNGACRTDPKPIRWDYLQDTSRKRLHDTYAALLKLRAFYPDLATGQTTYALNANFKYLQVVAGELSAMVVGNFDVVPATASVTFASSGTWYDYLDSDTIKATGVSQSLDLAPGEYHVYLNKNLKAADTTITDTVPTPVTKLGLALYPNPAVGGSTMISYELPVAGNSTLEIYSISGTRVAVVNMGSQAAGKYGLQAGQFPLDPAALPNGYYILQLTTTAGTAHVQFVVVH
jgi:hypothetical protein